MPNDLGWTIARVVIFGGLGGVVAWQLLATITVLRRRIEPDQNVLRTSARAFLFSAWYMVSGFVALVVGLASRQYYLLLPAAFLLGFCAPNAALYFKTKAATKRATPTEVAEATRKGEPTPQRAVASLLRVVAIIRWAFVAILPFYAFLGELLSRGKAKPADSFVYIIFFLAFLNAAVVMVIRVLWVPKAARTLQQDPTNMANRMPFAAASLIALCGAFSIGLYGFVARFMGEDIGVACAFYGMALLLLLALSPKRALQASSRGVS